MEDIQSAQNLVEKCLITLYPNPFITAIDKVEKINIPYCKWLYKNTVKFLKNVKLTACQWQRCKTIAWIIFRCVFHNTQIEAV